MKRNKDRPFMPGFMKEDTGARLVPIATGGEVRHLPGIERF